MCQTRNNRRYFESVRSRFWATFSIALSLALPSCTQQGPSTLVTRGAHASSPASAPSPQPTSLTHFTAHLDAANRTLTIRSSAPTTPAGGALRPQSVDPISRDPTAGAAPPPNTVDLVSTNCIDSWPLAPTFQCDVEVVSHYTRSLANLYVQIPSITENGVPVTGHDALNGDAYSPLGLDPTHGLWGYTNASEDPNAASGVLTSAATGFNTGTRTWIFANPDDASTDIDIATYASEGFSSYYMAFPNSSLPGYVNACAGGTSVMTPVATGIGLPFDFTIYNTNATSVNITSSGEVTFGAVPTTTADLTPLALPDPSAPAPAFFAFWDGIGANYSGLAAGAGDAGATCSTAPEVVTWDPTTAASILTVDPLFVSDVVQQQGGSARTTVPRCSGKWYWEIEIDAAAGLPTPYPSYPMIGVGDANAPLSGSYIGGTADGWSYYPVNAEKYNDSGIGNYGPYGTAGGFGDVIGVALDIDDGTLTFYKNGVSQGVAFTNIPSGEPLYPMVGTAELYFGATARFTGPFAYPPPDGYAPYGGIALPATTPQMCYQTLGEAPNRQFVIEWRNMDFLNAPGGPNLGASLDFEAFLFEGTGEIDTVYNEMTGDAKSDGRENGGFAWVGLQNETGTAATGEYEIEDYGSGNSWGYVPLP